MEERTDQVAVVVTRQTTSSQKTICMLAALIMIHVYMKMSCCERKSNVQAIYLSMLFTSSRWTRNVCNILACKGAKWGVSYNDLDLNGFCSWLLVERSPTNFHFKKGQNGQIRVIYGGSNYMRGKGEGTGLFAGQAKKPGVGVLRFSYGWWARRRWASSRHSLSTVGGLVADRHRFQQHRMVK